MSIAVTAMPTGTRKRTGSSTHVHPSASTMSTATTGTASSTTGWYAGIRSPQSRHRPRSSSHETTGISSRGSDAGPAGRAVAGSADDLGPRPGVPLLAELVGRLESQRESGDDDVGERSDGEGDEHAEDGERPLDGVHVADRVTRGRCARDGGGPVEPVRISSG